MNRLACLIALLAASGCAGSSGGGHSAAPARSAAPVALVRVPSGNRADGSIIPRLHRAGLLVAIPEGWTAWSYAPPLALLGSPVAGSHVRPGTVVTLRMTVLHGIAVVLVGRHVVPDVVGETLRQATRLIDLARVPWHVRASALPPTATGDLLRSYCVVAQTPSSGSMITIAASVRTRWVDLRARPCQEG